MALTKADVYLWDRLRALEAIPPKPAVLELGQSNWYGDIPPPVGLGGADWFKEGRDTADLFAIARSFYKSVLDYKSITSIDLNGTDEALKLDLNEQLGLQGTGAFAMVAPFDVVINGGTMEHVFDQAQVFRTIHRWAAPGALIVHAGPLQGWFGHGFYNYQPELFHAVGEANGYKHLLQFIWRLSTPELVEFKAGYDVAGPLTGFDHGNTMFYIAQQKGKDGRFVTPIQKGYK